MEKIELTKKFLEVASKFTNNKSFCEYIDLAAKVDNRIIITDGTKILFIPSKSSLYKENIKNFENIDLIDFRFAKKYKNFTVKAEKGCMFAFDNEEAISTSWIPSKYIEKEKIEKIEKSTFNELFFLEANKTIKDLKNYLNKINEINKKRKLNNQLLINRDLVKIKITSENQKIEASAYYSDFFNRKEHHEEEKIGSFGYVKSGNIADFKKFFNLQRFLTCLETFKKTSEVKDFFVYIAANYETDRSVINLSVGSGESIILCPCLE